MSCEVQTNGCEFQIHISFENLLNRIPAGNEFAIEGLSLGDRLLVVSTTYSVDKHGHGPEFSAHYQKCREE